MQNSKKIFVAVTGSSPQILTETIYALYKERNWVPDEVHVLTTLHGKNKIVDKLFNEGKYQQLCEEYSLHNIRFSEQNIHVLNDNQGELLQDIRTIDENTSAANQIVQFIHDLCLDDNNEIHVSIAGGRKSMGFYIGYALSLFGRKQDSLSHVLVAEPYEQVPEFFYPTKKDKWMKTYDSKQEVNAKDAQVWLADIPFVRMGEGTPNLELTEDWDYQKAVHVAQAELTDFKVVIDIEKQTLVWPGFMEIKLPFQQLALYATVAKFSKQGKVVGEVKFNDNTVTYQELAQEYYDLHERFGKAHNLSLEKLASTEQLEPDILRILRESSSKIARAIREQLGEYAEHFSIYSFGKSGDKKYKLNLKRENILIQ